MTLSKDDHSKLAGTISARTGERHRDHEWPRPESIPIYQTSVFTFDDVDDVLEYYADKPPGRYLYSRNGNPNVVSMQEVVAQLEHAESACASASGMGAISAAIMAACNAGDHVLLSREIYGGTLVLLRTLLQRFSISVSLADFTNLSEVVASLTPSTRLIIGESITNPLLSVVDIKRLAELAHDAGALLMIDNTFATPIVIRPIEFGADIVVHSATKYLGGHSDVSGGVICGSRAFIEQASHVITTLGSNLAPFDAWLIARGIKTLPLRFKQQCHNAETLAKWFHDDERVQSVYYPALSTHTTYQLAKKQFDEQLYGAIVTIGLKGDKKVVNSFMRATPSLPFAPSLAGVTTSLSHPWTTSHRGFTEQERLAFGITEGLIRISVGVENVQDLIEEINAGLIATT